MRPPASWDAAAARAACDDDDALRIVVTEGAKRRSWRCSVTCVWCLINSGRTLHVATAN